MRVRARGLLLGMGVAVAVAGARGAEARSFMVGSSLGMIFVPGGISERGDYLGALLRPGPCVGVHGRWGDDLAGAELPWEGTAALAVFNSDQDAALRVVYVPLAIGPVWEVASVQDVALHLRITTGMAFISANMGDRRTMYTGLLSGGAGLRRSIHDVSVALDFSGGVHLPDSASRIGRVLPVFQVRLTVFAL